jgi:hypothetical protein
MALNTHSRLPGTVPYTNEFQASYLPWAVVTAHHHGYSRVLISNGLALGFATNRNAGVSSGSAASELSRESCNQDCARVRHKA